MLRVGLKYSQCFTIIPGEESGKRLALWNATQKNDINNNGWMGYRQNKKQ